jgi:ABC-type branched-subunit amino acid transport system ATPase component
MTEIQPEQTVDSSIAVQPPDDTALVRVRKLVAGYGSIMIIHDLNIDVHEGEIVCVIGPNGAGKSTVFKAVYGFITPRSGSVHFGDTDITGMTPGDILRQGITYVPQGRSTFPEMTVEENLKLGMYIVNDRRRIDNATERVLEMFPRLRERRTQLAGTMSGGEQRMLEIGRALMLDPKVLMLDEPSAGLAPLITKQVFTNVQRLNQDYGLTVFMIEQNARQGLSISHRGYVLELGKNRFQGTGEALLHSEQVQRMYLGGAH